MAVAARSIEDRANDTSTTVQTIGGGAASVNIIQFVATTHSPFIVQTLRPGELIPLDGQPLGDEYGKLGIEDIAVAERVVELARQRGIGRELAL